MRTFSVEFEFETSDPHSTEETVRAMVRAGLDRMPKTPYADALQIDVIFVEGDGEDKGASCNQVRQLRRMHRK